MTRSTRRARVTEPAGVIAVAGTLSSADAERVRKERDRHTQGGGTWQAWNRILGIVEDCLRVQQEYDEAAQQQAAAGAPNDVSVERWLAAGGTV